MATQKSKNANRTSDKPQKVNLALSSIAEETESPEPFILGLEDGRRIVFPDLFDIPIEEAEEFFDDLHKRGQNDIKFLRKWISEEDYAAYRSAGINLRKHAAIMTRVLDYYESTMKTKLGEGDASTR